MRSVVIAEIPWKQGHRATWPVEERERENCAGTVDKVGRLELLWEERRQLVPFALRR